jgi:hypothetical protein
VVIYKKLIVLNPILIYSCAKDIDKHDLLKSIYSSKIEKYFDDKILSYPKRSESVELLRNNLDYLNMRLEEI